jgi:hypothetical protein
MERERGVTDDWPFDDPPNTATYTTVNVLERRAPILLVTHDEDDGAWQLHCRLTNDVKDARVIGLDCALGLDPTLRELADLPVGWCAYRAAPGQPWVREPNPSEYDEVEP